MIRRLNKIFTLKAWKPLISGCVLACRIHTLLGDSRPKSQETSAVPQSVQWRVTAKCGEKLYWTSLIPWEYNRLHHSKKSGENKAELSLKTKETLAKSYFLEIATAKAHMKTKTFYNGLWQVNDSLVEYETAAITLDLVKLLTWSMILSNRDPYSTSYYTQTSLTNLDKVFWLKLFQRLYGVLNCPT